MSTQSIETMLDHMGVLWDDPIRADAARFAARDFDEKLVWLFVEQRRWKRGSSLRGHVATAVSSIGASALLIAYAILSGGSIPLAPH